MDARIEKSIKKIQDAFLVEKKGKPTDKIKVTDLCRRAGVNKTTFYNHYRDVFHLAETMENDFIREILSDCEQTIPTIISDPRAFFTELAVVSMQREVRLRRLFRDQFLEYMDRLSRALIAEYAEYFPSEGDKVLVKICLVGFPYLLEKDFSDEKLKTAIDWICKIIETTKRGE